MILESIVYCLLCNTISLVTRRDDNKLSPIVCLVPVRVCAFGDTIVSPLRMDETMLKVLEVIL